MQTTEFQRVKPVINGHLIIIVSSGDKIVDVIQVDANTFANITTSSVQYTLPDNNIVKIDTTRNAKTYYQYEVEENDKKRSIKVIKPELVTTITNEFLEVINV